MANSLHAEILYSYLVEGESQQSIADRVGIPQSQISQLVREEYGLNKGNRKFGKGNKNQSGRYSDLSYDDICAFIDSGSRDIDAWLSGNDNGYEDDYEEEYEEEYYDEDDSDDYYDDPQPSGGQGYGNNSYNSNVPQPMNSYSSNQPYVSRSGKKQTYVNVDNYSRTAPPSKTVIDGRIVLLCLGIVILFVGYLVNKLGSSGSVFGNALTILWKSEFLWIGVVAGGFMGCVNYSRTRTISGAICDVSTWSWTGVAYFSAGIVFFVKYGLFLPSLILAALGVVIFFVGLKLFYRE